MQIALGSLRASTRVFTAGVSSFWAAEALSLSAVTGKFEKAYVANERRLMNAKAVG